MRTNIKKEQGDESALAASTDLLALTAVLHGADNETNRSGHVTWWLFNPCKYFLVENWNGDIKIIWIYLERVCGRTERMIRVDVLFIKLNGKD